MAKLTMDERMARTTTSSPETWGRVVRVKRKEGEIKRGNRRRQKEKKKKRKKKGRKEGTQKKETKLAPGKHSMAYAVAIAQAPTW